MAGSRIAAPLAGSLEAQPHAASHAGAHGEPDAGRPAAERAADALLERAEVRDVLAWLRLLADPHDAAAVVRALARPPIELHQVELARVIQAARRRTPTGGTGKLGLVRGLASAAESPHVPPEARERIQRFLRLHASAAAELDAAPPDAFLPWLVRHLRAGGRPPLLALDPRQRSAGIERLQQLADEYIASAPLAGTRELVQHLAGVAPAAGRAPHRTAPPAAQPRDQRQDDRALALDRHAHADLNLKNQHDSQPDRELHAALATLREEVLDGVARIGGRLGELRLDTDLDISHGVVRYLELLKVCALLQRPAAQSLHDALADVNARLLAAVTPLQRDILQTSTLDRTLLAGGQAGGETGGEPRGEGPRAAARERARAGAILPREQRSLGPFLPRKGAGLALSASDIHTYRACPLRYKYARVLRIPLEQTPNQRFGIVVHQVLERYQAERGHTLEQLLTLLERCWRRAGFGETGVDRDMLHKARAALTRYHQRLRSQRSQPVWFERSFSFRLGPHHLRGRVDRVDRLPASAEPAGAQRPARGASRGQRADAEDRSHVEDRSDAEYLLIDYKTSRPKSARELGQDIQLSLYALAAREDWGLRSTQQAYHYVLDDLQVPVPSTEPDAGALERLVLEVGEGILAQEFEPTPSPRACAMCDYRIACPAAAVG